MGMQAKLLRALQERSVRPVGGSQEFRFDTRIVAATNRDVDAEVANKRLREDLYYRINVVSIDVPALRARGNDVLELAQYFLTRSARRSKKPVVRLGVEAAERLISYDWPGNVRELENCVEHAVALAAYDEITVNDLPPKIRDEATAVAAAGDPSELPSIRTVEYRYIRKVLQVVSGNKTLAAKVMGFDRRTLYRKLAAFSRPEVMRGGEPH
jgi:two-component system, NtrC family, response regulator AtoC